MEKAYVYVLKCSEGKYYVRQSKFPTTRLEDHFAGDGSTWTNRYPPL